MCLCVAAIQIAFHPGIFECFVSSFGGGRRQIFVGRGG